MRFLLVAFLVTASLVAGCVEKPPEILPAGLDYLRGAQNPDGGFPATPGGASDFSTTAWCALALAAAGATGSPEAQRAGAYLAAQAGAVRNGTTGSLSRLNPVSLYVLSRAALGHPGEDLVPLLGEEASNSSLQVNERVYLLGALGRAGQAAQTLHDGVRAELAQNASSPLTRDAWFRAQAILALLASGGDPGDAFYREAARSLLLFQKQGSGFRSVPDYEPDASTTAAVVAVLHKVPFVYSDEVNTGRAFLDKLQKPDGSVRFSEEHEFAPVKTTAEAIVGFTGRGPFAA